MENNEKNKENDCINNIEKIIDNEEKAKLFNNDNEAINPPKELTDTAMTVLKEPLLTSIEEIENGCSDNILNTECDFNLANKTYNHNQQQKLVKSHIKFEFNTWYESLLELTEFSAVQFYNFLIFTFGYSINFYYLSKTYPESRTNELMVKAIGMSNLFFNTFVIAILRGVTSGFDILASNCLGAHAYKKFWQTFFAAALVTITTSLFISLISYFYGLEIITFFFYIDTETRILIENYLFYLTLAIPILSFSFILTKLATVTKENRVFSLLLTVNLITEIFSSYVFIQRLKLGVSGASFALFTSRSVLVITALIYFFIIKPFNKESMRINYRHILNDSWKYIKFTSANFLSLCINSFQMEIGSIIAAYSSDMDYIAFVLYATIGAYFSNLCSALGSSMVAFCGNNIASNRKDEFKKHSFLSFVMLISLAILFLTIIAMFEDSVFGLIISSVSTISYMKSVFCLYFFWQISNSIYSLQSYLFRSLHLQNYYMHVSLINYYCIQLTLCITLAIVYKYYIIGVFVGMLTGNIIGIILSFRKLISVDLDVVYNNVIKECNS